MAKSKVSKYKNSEIFIFENRIITISEYDNTNIKLTGKELRENYCKLLAVRNNFDLKEDIIKYAITALYKTKSEKNFNLYLSITYNLEADFGIYNILCDDRESGIITKRMMEDD